MSMREISIAIRAENRASSVFRTISSDVLSLGMSFGALDSAQGRTVMQIFSVVRLMTSLKAIVTTMTATQAANNVVVGAGAGVQTTFAISTGGAVTAQVAQNTATDAGIVSQTLSAMRTGISAVAHGVYAAACWISTAAQSALNISYATFLALTVVGIAVIAAAAVAMFAFANSMNSATSSVHSFNSASSNLSSSGKSITRAGGAALYRRGIE